MALNDNSPLHSSILRRVALMEAHRGDPDLQASTIELCRRDAVLWINDWVWTYDPRTDVKFLPFDLFPVQERFIRWLQEQETARKKCIVDKSRDMGVTYLACAYALHKWLFVPGDSTAFGSRKLDYVDLKGNPKSIFEKLRVMIRDLPPWMLPRGWNPDRHSNYCRIENPATGATITGEGGDDIGRGGRVSRYFLDEAAYIERPDLIERSLSTTTNFRIDISTPNGNGNPFATKRHSGDFPVFTLHWRDDPRKGEEWYRARRIEYRNDPVTLAQEIDIDYTASQSNTCIPGAWVRAAVELDLPSDALSVTAGLDVADDGGDLCVFTACRGPRVIAIEDWSHTNTTQSAFKAMDLAERHKVVSVNYDSVGIGAGVKGTVETSERPSASLFHAVNVGEAPTERHWLDGKTSKEKFRNLRAEAWWALRARFERTWEHVNGQAVYPADELISIPDHAVLISELSQPMYSYTETGKVEIEKKSAMRKRGVKSPDFAESLMLANLPVKGEVFRPEIGPERFIGGAVAQPDLRAAPPSPRPTVHPARL